MQRNGNVRAGMVGVVVGCCAALLGFGGVWGVGAARGQVLSMTTRTGIGGETGPPVTRDHLKQYARVLGLSADQLAAAELLVDAAIQQHTLAKVEMTEKLGDLRAEAAESGDWHILMDEMPPVREKYAAAREKIEKDFFDDLKLLLTPDQETKWDAVERTHRRLTTIGQGALAGECVDLVALCGALDPPADVQEKLAPILDRYELELDRALVDRNALQDEQGAMMMPSGTNGARRLDMDAISKLTAKIREASEKVRDVNQSYARQIGGILTGDLAAQFETLWRKGSYPKVYAKTYTSKVLTAATGFEDLTDDQRARLKQLAARYERELDAANKKWVKAIEESEGEGGGGVMMGAGGQMMMVEMGDEQGGPVDDARKARLDLNRNYLAQVRGLLSPEQRERLPERQLPQRAGGAGPGGGTQMEFIAVQEDDGAPPPPPPDNGKGQKTVKEEKR